MTVRRAVHYGDGAILRTPEVVAGRGASRVLLVCGARSFEASGAARMLPELTRVAQVRRWSEFAPNTDAADLHRGLGIVEEFAPDLVLGVGGGSAMDMAKLLCAYRGLTDEAKLHEAIRSGEPVTTRETSLLLAPTTSGSGSEATHFAVVYIGERKYSVAGPAMRPDVAILDPALSLSGSPYQRATSGIDAVAQAIESLWAVSATDRSRHWARRALGLMLPAIEAYVTGTGDGGAPPKDAARAMAIGSHLAGRAIDISKTTGAHALSYAITKRYGVSHGHAVSLTLGAFIEAHAAAPPAALLVVPARHREVVREIIRRLGAADGAGARARFQALLTRLGLATSLYEVGARTPEQRRGIAEAVNPERMGNNPVRFTARELVQLVDGIG